MLDREWSKKEGKKNCPNCGAPIDADICPYCGTEIVDYAVIDMTVPQHIRLRLNDGRIIVANVVAETASLETGYDDYCDYFDIRNCCHSIHVRNTGNLYVNLRMIEEEGVLFKIYG